MQRSPVRPHEVRRSAHPGQDVRYGIIKRRNDLDHLTYGVDSRTKAVLWGLDHGFGPDRVRTTTDDAASTEDAEDAEDAEDG